MAKRTKRKTVKRTMAKIEFHVDDDVRKAMHGVTKAGKEIVRGTKRVIRKMKK